MVESTRLLKEASVVYLGYETETMAYTDHLLGVLHRMWLLTLKVG